jgi:transketolase C-terminal domain/subunit
VEEAWVAGGLGSLAAETIAEKGLRCRLSRCGVRMPFLAHSGSRAYLLRQHGLDAGSLAAHGLALTTRRVAA